MRRFCLKDLAPQEIERLCRRNPPADESVQAACREVFAAVRENGDRALREYTARFDGVHLAELRVSEGEFERAEKNIPPEDLGALETATRNIRRFHESQFASEPPVEVQPGVVCWRESRPISCVGIYIPGGTAVLPSSVLMLGVPARLAGCPRIVVCVPPRSDGSVLPQVLAAARLCGIREVFKVGGAQAVAALALGTESVPRVEKILGPGNRWVQGAKLLATFYGVAVDMVAGPSEVLVVADASARPELVAADLLSQAEHGEDSRAVLVTTSEILMDAVETELERQLAALPRRELAGRALEASFSALAGSLEEALDFANRYAPEHLILQVEEPRKWVGAVSSAGSVFLGEWSPEVAGDYASGTNHALPTSGLARAFSGVSVDSFVKRITFQELSRQGLADLAPTLERLALMEGLEAHRRAVRMRFEERPARSGNGSASSHA